MTNSPTYNKQLALSEYWKSIGGLNFLPGTNRAVRPLCQSQLLHQRIARDR